MFVVLTFAFSVSLAEAADPAKADLSKRQTQIGDKRAPMKVQEMKMNDQLTSKRFPIKEWHGQYSSLGNRRAAIDVRETRDKKIIQPQVMDMKTKELKMSPMGERKAFVRNFDQVQDRSLVPAYRDARVVAVNQAATAAPSRTEQGKTPSMRDINRFTFQRNHSDAEGLKIQKAGSGEKE